MGDKLEQLDKYAVWNFVDTKLKKTNLTPENVHAQYTQ
jgi:hypothetical protein